MLNTQTKKRERISPIWGYFKKTNHIKKDTASCNTCLKTLSTKWSSTSGLIRHLECEHKSKFTEYLKLNEDALQVTNQDQSKKLKQMKIFETQVWKNTDEKSKAITKKIGIWLAAGLMPYNSVELLEFIELIQLLQPKYKVPGRLTFSHRIIPKLANDLAQQIKDDLIINNNYSSVSFTSDLWTSIANSSFISLTIHFITEEFELKSLVLGVKHFPGTHSGFLISQKLNEIFLNYDLKDLSSKNAYIITDNGRNMLSGIRNLNVVGLTCFAHTLQLMINDVRKETNNFNETLEKARKIVGHYKHSAKATTRLHEKQVALELPVLELVQDCKTRWNSEFRMLDRLLLNKQALNDDLTAEGELDTFSLNEWKTIEGYVKVLGPLDHATTEVCSDRLPTSSMVRPIIFGIQSLLEEYISINPKVGLLFAKNLLITSKTKFEKFLQP